nr:reverse transcriptase domain-containing protein [Tanacetum cinerariifolium]
MRIEQYIQMMDYALWDVLENSPTLLKTQVVEGVTTLMPITFVKDKAQRRLEVKTRSTLMLGIPNKHQLKFNSIKDAKQLMKAIEKRDGFKMADGHVDNKGQKGVQRSKKLRYQAQGKYKKDSLIESPTSTALSGYDWSDQTEEGLNYALMAYISTSSDSKRNKVDLDTMSMDDLYNNLKVYEPEVKVNTALGVSTSDTKVITANIDNLSDVVICAFLASQPSSPQLAKRFLKKTRRKLTINGNETIGFDKTNVECYICHKRGHFAREYRAPRIQDTKHKESTRKTMHVETPDLTALVSCDGLGGYDWSDQAKEGNFMPPKPYLPYIGLDEFAVKLVVENKSSKEETKATNVECYICHKRGHFAKECRAPRIQDTKHKESTRKTMPVETPDLTALVSCDGLGGYDWSNQAKEGPNYALMAYTSISLDSKSDDEDETVPQPKIEMKTVKPSVAKRAGESIEDFVRRYKLEKRDVKGAPECMQIFGFVHGITNPEPIKQPHDKIPKTVDEMMRVTTSFLSREVAASSHERKKSFPPWRQQEGHNTDERRHLKKQIEEMLKTGKMSHLIKELKQNNEKEQLKAAKKGETSGKDKALAILMAVLLTAHGMLNLPIEGGIITLKSSRLVPLECALVFRPKETSQAPKPMVEERVQVAINPEYPKQTKPADMTSVPRHLAEHHLNIREGCLPVRQKNRGQATNRNHAIHEEVGKLIEAGIMKEVHYHEDEEKTAFITSQGIFCYTKMPFGLRNVGATYQCLVDKAFHKQIGRNLKVYVDDLLIKSRTKDEIVRDIEETFKTLRETNMKLNPKKCTFGVEEGMFLGYTVNTKELKVCPDKGIKRYGDKLYINREISARLGTCQQAPKEILSSTPDYSNYRPTVTTGAIKTRSSREAIEVEH